MIVWEWLGEGSIERQIEVTPVLSSGEDYAGGYTYDEFAPTEQESFKAKGLTWAQITTLRTNVRTKDSTFTAQDKLNRSFSGRLLSVRWAPIDGTEVFEVTISLLIPPEEP
jgi:hypothetical protein